MTTHIVITGHEVGETLLSEHVGRRGRTKLVATYRANIERPDGSLFWFAVTRDSARVVFGLDRDRFCALGECPPSRKNNPYYACYHNAPRNGECLVLYETKQEAYVLRGEEKFERSSILIHQTPASSLGCFGVAGEVAGYAKFWAEISAATNHFLSGCSIRVHVEPRPDHHHTRLLAP